MFPIQTNNPLCFDIDREYSSSLVSEQLGEYVFQSGVRTIHNQVPGQGIPSHEAMWISTDNTGLNIAVVLS